MSDVTVNKARLAHWLGVSLPTLSKWLLKYGADFPVIERGANGRDYAFDPAAVAAFLRAKQAEQAALKSAADEQLAQLRLPFDLPGVEPPPKVSSTKGELMAWELRKRQRQEAEAAGKLVPAERVRSALAALLGRLSRDSHAFLRQIGREQGWPEALTATVVNRWAQQQRATVAAARADLGAIDLDNDAAAR
jgi:phage terminase Nu1 subunit (DNA packaging protein)